MLRTGLLCVLMVQMTWGLCPDTTTQSAERLSNAVTLKFYRAQVDTWTTDENSAKVAVQVADKAQAYCAASASACGLETCCSSAFKETDVGTETGYPKNNLKDLELRIYLDLPASINATASPQCVISKTVLMKIVDLARDSIHDETGHWITYVDDEFYGIPPASDLNKIIIPIAFVILLFVAGLTLGLKLWKKKKDSDARRLKIIEDRKKHSKAKVGPTYHIEKDPSKGPGGLDDRNGKPEKPKRKDQLYRDSLLKQLKDGRDGRDGRGGKGSTATSEPYQRQGYAFEKKQDVDVKGATGRDRYDGTNTDGNSYPMQTYQMHRDAMEPGNVPASHLRPIRTEAAPESESVPTTEKKKKKKKKRYFKDLSKSKENMRDGQDNSSYMDSDSRP